VVIWYIFPRFGILYGEKSGKPVWKDVEQKNVFFPNKTKGEQTQSILKNFVRKPSHWSNKFWQ
jgi:hypothetical protein